MTMQFQESASGNGGFWLFQLIIHGLIPFLEQRAGGYGGFWHKKSETTVPNGSTR